MHRLKSKAPSAALCFALAGGALPGMVWGQAAPSDATPLQWRASVAAQQDSNLFRLPPGANSVALTGRSGTDETVTSDTLGASFHTRQSLQTIDLDVSVVDSQYQHYGYLNYTGTNYTANWAWELTPYLRGGLNSTRAETLNSFTDYAGFGQRNKRTDTASGFTLDYAAAASWHVTSGLSTSRQSNEQALYAGGDFTSHSESVGLRYTPSTGNTVSYMVRTSTGNYFNQTLPSPSAIDNTYSELDQVVDAQWTSDDGSQVLLELMPFQRTQPNYPQRNYSGVNTSATVQWSPTARTSLTANLAHQISSYATATSNYSTTDTATLGATYGLNTRSSLSLQQQWSQVDYVQLDGLASGPDRRDTLLTTSLTLNWQPRDHLAVSTSVQSLSRSTNAANLDYQATVFFINATFTY